MSWLDPRLEARDLAALPNNGGGKGIFTIDPINCGTCLAVFGGYVMSVRDEPDGDYALQIADDFVIGPRDISRLETADYFNHSCDPNAGIHGQLMLVAMRDLAADEPVCFDYAMVLDMVDYRFICQCGSAQCRGVITGRDWRRMELQRRYAGFFSWHVQQKILHCVDSG
jgi:hypothetical protein